MCTCVNEDWKFTLEFEKKFKTLERAFIALVPSTTLASQFQNFLIEHHGTVRTMDEKGFVDFLLGQSPHDTRYGDFVKLTIFSSFAN